MQEEPASEQRPSDKKLGWYVVGLPGFLLLYVLSVGPFALACRVLGIDGWDAVNVLGAVYFPVAWLCERVPVFGELMESYVEWWVNLVSP